MAYRGTSLTPFFGTPSIFGLRREIDRLFENASGTQGSRGMWMPAVDVHEDQNEIAIDLELPGMRPEDVDVSVENGILTISGEKRIEREEGEGRFHHVERSYGSFVRSFTLPQGINEEQIEASYDSGVLTVHIPKAALPQPRRIQIGGEREVTGRAAREPARTSGRTGGQRGGGAAEETDTERMVAGESERRRESQK